MLNTFFLSFVLSLFRYLKYLAEYKEIKSITPVITEVRPIIPKIFFCNICITKEQKTFFLHPPMFGG